MSGVALGNPARSAACDAILGLLNGGTTESSGAIKLFASDLTTVVANLPLNNPAFGSASNGVATMNTSPAVEDTDAAGGTVATATFVNRDGTDIFAADVATTSGAIVLDPLTIPAGARVTMTSLTFTVPPGTL